ncbi:hypothetical protein MY11210_003937 [Beauveria gryllotalpidicola]
MDRDRDRGRRFDDGEVVRYGAGESWRPTPRDRSPRRARSPARSRDRGPPRSPRARSPPPRPRSPGMGSGPGGSDSYVPGRYNAVASAVFAVTNVSSSALADAQVACAQIATARSTIAAATEKSPSKGLADSRHAI